MGREVVNIRSSDVIIIIGGRSGTLGEFSIAYDEGKLIGVLIGTGGITAEIKHIVKIIKKRTGARIIYGRDPRIRSKNCLITIQLNITNIQVFIMTTPSLLRQVDS